MVGNAIYCSNASEVLVICLSGSVSELHRRVRIAICLPFGSMQISGRSSLICPSQRGAAFQDASNDRNDGVVWRPVHDTIKWQIQMYPADHASKECPAYQHTHLHNHAHHETMQCRLLHMMLMY